MGAIQPSLDILRGWWRWDELLSIVDCQHPKYRVKDRLNIISMLYCIEVYLKYKQYNSNCCNMGNSLGMEYHINLVLEALQQSLDILKD